MRLKDQYRMNDHICSIPAAMWYDGNLKAGMPRVGNARFNVDLTGIDELPRAILEREKSVKFVDVPLDDTGGPRTNLREARIVGDIVRSLIQAGYDLEREDALGIVCPRRAQVELVRRQLESLLGEMHLSHSEKGSMALDSVSTVDRFQGSQRDMIIVSFGMTDDTVSQHLSDEKRLNVAISRARHKLVLVGNRAALSDDEVFSRLFKTIENQLPYEDWFVTAQ